MNVFFVGAAALVLLHGIVAVAATQVLARHIAAINPPAGRFVAVPGGRLHLYDLAPRETPDGPPIVLVHGATSNARDMVAALGDVLSSRHRVIALDRPGHGWSDRPRGRDDAAPARQAGLIAAALDTLGVDRVVLVGHSLAASVVAAFALDAPERTAGLVVLAGATHPWPGGIAWYYRLAAMPILGAIFVNTVVAPIGALGLAGSAAASFAPLSGPSDYTKTTAAALVLRPHEFRWNAQDVADLKGHLARQAPRYAGIRAPTAILASLGDCVVSPDVHARMLARQVPAACLTLLEGKGHQIHYTAQEMVVSEIERIAALARKPALAS
jgi:pimeloyl-ACP methyl ester carboxylesterase